MLSVSSFGKKTAKRPSKSAQEIELERRKEKLFLLTESGHAQNYVPDQVDVAQATEDSVVLYLKSSHVFCSLCLYQDKYV